jgi:uncharacterized membrane protein YhiD involved in acid resistance
MVAILACGSIAGEKKDTDAKDLFTPGGETQKGFTFAQGLDIACRLVLAMVFGAVVALHPMRLLRGELTKKKLDTIKAQILIMGLGSFIRFRTSVKDPRETAIMFLLIGLGMAAGLEMYWVGALAAAFLFIILFPMEWTLGRSVSLLKVVVETPDTKTGVQVLRPIFERMKLKIIKTKANVKRNKVTFQVMKKDDFDLAALQAAITDTKEIKVEAVSFDEMAGEDTGVGK